MSITKKTPVIPEAYKELKDSALLNSRDIAKIFGYKGNRPITMAYQRGNIPKPSKSIKCGIRIKAKEHNFWTLGTIRKWGEKLLEGDI